MQPLSETTHTRPWHWGVAFLGEPSEDVPNREQGQVVSVNQNGIAIAVRHAQDIGADRFEGDWDWATATFHVRVLTEAEAVERDVVCDFVLAAVDEQLPLGDADGYLQLPSPSTSTRVIVSTDYVDAAGLKNVWVDLVALDD